MDDFATESYEATVRRTDIRVLRGEGSGWQ